MRNFGFTLVLAAGLTGCSATAATGSATMASTASEAMILPAKLSASKATGFGKGIFNRIAVMVIDRLMHDFQLTAVQAAGIVGNLAHESGGFAIYQEQAPRAGRGGAGWAQWTGSRRVAFEAWADEHGFDLHSIEANYGFLNYELETSHKDAIKAVKKTSSIEAAMRVFEATYERAGIKHYPSRQKWAERAYDAWVAAHG